MIKSMDTASDSTDYGTGGLDEVPPNTDNLEKDSLEKAHPTCNDSDKAHPDDVDQEQPKPDDKVKGRSKKAANTEKSKGADEAQSKHDDLGK
jgi:hypothetical protein